MGNAVTKDSGGGYAISLADQSYDWYRTASIRARRAHRVSELLIIVASAAIPLAAVFGPDDATIPAILGAAVVVISAVRTVFHWHDNYIRFSAARETVEAERRMFHTSAAPYDDPST